MLILLTVLGAGAVLFGDAAAAEGVLLQYGALGATALLAVFAVRVMFVRQVASHERDIARADKAERELADINRLIREQLVAQLTRATDVIGRVAEQLEDQRRSGDRGRSG